MSQAWTGSSDSPDHIAMVISRLPQSTKEQHTRATKDVLEHAAQLNAHVPVANIAALYEDREVRSGLLDRLGSPLLALGAWWYYLPEAGDIRPAASNWSLLGSSSPRWLSIDWFERSPYSPNQLQMVPSLTDDATKWRRAFEDLMLAALDKPMDSQCPVHPLGIDGMTGLQWVLDMHNHGILPPLLPRFYGEKHARSQLEHTSIVDIIRRCNAPWGDERFPWSNPLSRDFAELRTALATWNTVGLCDGESSVPATELDMYEKTHNSNQPGSKALLEYEKQLMLFEKTSTKHLLMERQEQDAAAAAIDARVTGAVGNGDDDCDDDDDEENDDEENDDDDSYLANQYRQQAMQIQEWQQRREAAGLVLTGDREDDFEDARLAFDAAVRKGDVGAATSVVNMWTEHYHHTDLAGGIVDLAAFPTWQDREVAMRALTQSELLKEAKLDDQRCGLISKALESLEDWEERHGGGERRRDLRRRLTRAIDGMGTSAGETSDATESTWEHLVNGRWHSLMDEGELERHVVGLEQQRQSLGMGNALEDDLLDEYERRYEESRKSQDARAKVGKAHVRELEMVEPDALSVGVANAAERIVEGKPMEAMKRPDVLSALTTTQTTRLPDGTVTTKVVLKKRFSDGREESSESVHTHHEGVEAELRKERQQEEAESQKVKGWFWS